MRVPYCNPVHPTYVADPFVLDTGRAGGAAGPRYLALGTGAVVRGRVFEVLASDDLVHWTPLERGALEKLPERMGTDYWAPEVAEVDGRWWMYYSLGVADRHHTLRVAVAEAPEGPYEDCGVDLTPHERFAIDPSPFRAADGTWYLFHARDVLEGERVGTMLAVDVLDAPDRLRGEPRTVLTPSGDWQLFRRQREMYGATYDWHTLEGPCVLHRQGRYWLFYSGGSWETETYAVSWAVADDPRGPWEELPGTEPMLRTVPGHVLGPGHNSVVTGPHGGDVLVYHAWDPGRTARRMCIDPLEWTPEGPTTPGPSWEPTTLPR